MISFIQKQEIEKEFDKKFYVCRNGKHYSNETEVLKNWKHKCNTKKEYKDFIFQTIDQYLKSEKERLTKEVEKIDINKIDDDSIIQFRNQVLQIIKKNNE